jgi:hypothetical protein
MLIEAHCKACGRRLYNIPPWNWAPGKPCICGALEIGWNTDEIMEPTSREEERNEEETNGS